MNMPVDGNRLAQRPENRFQLIIARYRCRSSPRTLGTGVYQGHLTLNLNAGQPPQAPDPLLSKHGTCNRCHPTDHRPKRGRADDWLANSSSDSGRKSISSVLPTTPCQPRSRMRSTISTGLEPESARSPPWRIKSGEVCCRSVTTASNAVRFPWMSDRIAVRIKEL